MDVESWKVVGETEAPGIPWAATSTKDALWFTLGEGPDDDRYLRRYIPDQGFAETPGLACPDLTGSYLSFDGTNLYLSQWYKGLILKLDEAGRPIREIAVGHEISGHCHLNGSIYVLRGTEQNGGDWRLAQLDPREQHPVVRDLARLPFQCRSLTYDGARLWTNYRDGNEIIRFEIPGSR